MASCPRPTGRQDFTIAIFCALPLEASAVRTAFDENWSDRGCPYKYGKTDGDTNAYSFGRIGNHNVALVHLPGMGKVSAASAATSVRSSFPRLHLALDVGICGGVPHPHGHKGKEIILGDVIISEGVIQYDFGRRFEDRFIRKSGPLDVLGRPKPEIRAFIAKLKESETLLRLEKNTVHHLKVSCTTLDGAKADYPGIGSDWLFESNYYHKHQLFGICEICDDSSEGKQPICETARDSSCQLVGCNEEHLVRRSRLVEAEKERLQPAPRIHFGLLASGDMVLKSAKERDALAAESGVIAVEMEVAGIWDVLPCIAIKAVCDYADSHKSKMWQNYAASTAAACMKAFLEAWDVGNDLPYMSGRLQTPATAVISAEENSSAGYREPLFTLPFEREGCFVGRSDITSRVVRSLNQTPRRTALYGVGGVGKSQIAIEHCYRYRAVSPGSHIIWIHGGSLTRFQSAYLDIVNRLKLAGKDCPISEKLQSVVDWLSGQHRSPWLMVIDNADDDNVFFGPGCDSLLDPGQKSPAPGIIQYLPRNTTGSILITTRNRRVGVRFSARSIVRVPTFELEDSTNLLRYRLIEEVEWDEIKAKELLQLLEFLPLAISQAASYINEEDVTIERYVTVLKDCSTERELLRRNYYDPSRDVDTPHAVFLTWQVSFNEILARNPRAAAILSTAAFLDRFSIPHALIQQDDEDPVSFDTALGSLKAYSFVNLVKQTQTLIIHRLVWACTRAWVEDRKETVVWQESALNAVSKRCPSSANFDHWSAWRVLLPHIEHVVQYNIGTRHSELQQASILTDTAIYDRRQGRYDVSAARAKQAVTMRQRHLGNDHPNTLEALYTLAMTLKSYGQYPAAEDAMRQVLRKREELLEDHPHTMAAMNGLARILGAQKRFEECERLSREMVARSETYLGPNHPDTLTALNSLGNTLSKMRKYEESERLFRRCFQYKAVALGKENRETLRAMANLGSALSNQGNTAEAKEILQEAIILSKRTLGEKDEDTILLGNSLGFVLQQVGSYDEAHSLLRRNVALCKEVFGPDHPRTLEYMRNLATLDGSAISS